MAAASALVAMTSAFGTSPAARTAAASHSAAAAPASRPSPQPMIPARLPGAQPAVSSARIKTVGSTNWAGYAVSRSHVTFAKLTATFFVPYLHCTSSPDAFSSHWVGLDGFSSSSVEQDGIEADCNGSTAEYAAWYETFPQPEKASSIVIRPGNSVTATVSYSSRHHTYELAVTDNTNGHHFNVYRKCAASVCHRSSAEVISEAPTVNGSQASLADYGAASFAAVSITSGTGKHGGISSSHWNTTKIEQVNSGDTVIGMPTALHGASFDNYWLGEG